MDSGNIGFVLLCAAFVFVMTPGLAMFYGGLVRKKNVVNTMMTSIFIIGIGIVMWVLFGYSLSFAPSGNAFIGDFRWLGLEGVSLTEGYTDGASIPNMVFSAFQMMFAVITPALITGAVAGRMKFKSIFVFTIFWSLIVYYPGAGRSFRCRRYRCSRLCRRRCCTYQFRCFGTCTLHTPRQASRL